MFGTDHPLFPSLREDGLYDICVKNQDAARDCFGQGKEYDAVMGTNAMRVFYLQ
jgi:aminocarboxymuconate-semialdehyde decarboxylase